MTRKRLKRSLAVRVALLRYASAVAPGWVARRVATAFVTPRPVYPARLVRADMPPADQSLRLATPGGFVGAWRWGGGPAVLLVHGWEDDHRSFQPLLRALRARGQGVVALDLPAHGRSGGRTLAMAAVIRAIGEVAQALGPVRAVVGHSLGGMASMLAAHDLVPDLALERLVLIAPPLSTKRTLLAVMVRLGLPVALRQRVERELEGRMGAAVEVFDLERAGQTLPLPGLIVHSRDDPRVPLASSEKLVKAWPRARLHVVDRLGHQRLLADEGVIATIVGFLCGPAGREGP